MRPNGVPASASSRDVSWRICASFCRTEAKRCSVSAPPTAGGRADDPRRTLPSMSWATATSPEGPISGATSSRPTRSSATRSSTASSPWSTSGPGDQATKGPHRSTSLTAASGPMDRRISAASRRSVSQAVHRPSRTDSRFELLHNAATSLARSSRDPDAKPDAERSVGKTERKTFSYVYSAATSMAMSAA